MVKQVADSTLIDTWAATGAIIDPGVSKVAEGWRLGERPPHEYMNWLQNLLGSKINHMLTWGVPQWNNTTEYVTGAFAGNDGRLWVSLTPNTGSEPAEGNVNWSLIPTLDAVAQSLSLTGAVMAFAMDTTPSGWLRCNGDAVSRTTYAGLFAVIGTTYGVGDGSTTFNLPDLRGEFVRGFDDGRGVDAGRLIGSAQADEIKAHTHGISPPVASDTGTAEQGPSQADDGTNVSQTQSFGGNETRPRNVAMLYCIRT